jgi:hypoxanthine phosphoribosyltransferase
VIDPAYIEEVLIPPDKLQARIAELGAAVSRDYAGQDLLLLAVLKGSVLFLADLMRHITVPHAIDFMATSSYGIAFESSGVVRILKDLDQSIEDRNVLIVEDIIDTGRTLDYLVRILRARLPRSLEICTLLNKPARREVNVPVKYIGFDIPDKFVLGYGLDFQEKYRNLPYVAVLEPKRYAGE